MINVNMKILNGLELISLNIVNASVIIWLNSVVEKIPIFVSVLVGLSMLLLNAIKIYKELKK